MPDQFHPLQFAPPVPEPLEGPGPHQLREHRRRGPRLDEQLLEDDPRREVVDRARVMLKTGQLKTALRILSLSAVELAFRANVKPQTTYDFTRCRRALPYNLNGFRVAEQVIDFCEKAEARMPGSGQ